MRKKSIIWLLSKEELFEIAENSKSINEILRHFGLSGGAFYTLKNRLINEGIDVSKFSKKTNEFRKKVKYVAKPLTEYMIENSTYSRCTLKKRIIKENILPYVCDICKCGPIWNNQDLVLVLDHINGVHNDHRKENLRFLCPNCNSQTTTFSGKNVFHEKKKCICGKLIGIKSNCCRTCSSFNTRKINWPNSEELQKMLWEIPTIEISNRLGVSDKAVKKHAAKFNLTWPSRGYWNTL